MGTGRGSPVVARCLPAPALVCLVEGQWKDRDRCLRLSHRAAFRVLGLSDAQEDPLRFPNFTYGGGVTWFYR